MSGTVQNSVDVKRFTDDREENPVGKSIGEHTSNISLAMNNPK